jgi:hypothetical protein
MQTGQDPKWGEPGPTHDPEILANFVARPTDVLITTTPKAGTTWLSQILHQLRTGGDADYFSIEQVVPWLELPRPDISLAERLAGYEAIPDPRIFKTHCTYEQTPGVDTARIILSSRDPRDCFVSYYHHSMDMTRETRQRIGLKQYRDLDEVFEDWLRQAPWYRNIQGWWPHYNDGNLLWLRYEDMKRDLPGSIDRINDFLGWDVNAVQRQTAIEYSSFEWMKQHAEKFTRQLSSNVPVFKAGGFIRKGEVGNFKNELTPEQERRIIMKACEWLTPDCLEFLEIG